VSRTAIEEKRHSKPKASKPTVAIVGSGSLATFLAVALTETGFRVVEIVSRDSPQSLRRAQKLATKIGSRAVTLNLAALDATLLWLCVPDQEIRNTASALASRLTALRVANEKSANEKDKSRSKVLHKLRFAFHSSGALVSRELASLRKNNTAIASVHPLMTFVDESYPSLHRVAFAIEGDERAKRLAREIVRGLGGESFSLPGSKKAAYHAWATMTSPLLLAFLVTLEEAAAAAGLTREDARHKSLPIIRQTLKNYERLGPARSFSGPLIRGDANTIAKHLEALGTRKSNQVARETYLALARSALRTLPVKNRKALKALLLKTWKSRVQSL
jgi:predicted short-subunit dehydrogenase-like oxidoreductase (DUF2520 family)